MQAVLKPRGICCPNCGSKAVNPDGWKRPMAGVRIRYFKCKGCTGRFRTKERVEGPLKPRNKSDVKTDN